MATKQTKRPRDRSIELEEDTSAAVAKDTALLKLIVEVFQANLAQNRAKKEYDTKRKELLAKMKNEKHTTKKVTVVDSEGTDPVTLVATVATPINEKASVKKLRDKVDEDTFLLIVSATKEAIVKFAGSAVFEQCKESVDGTENVSVSLLKE